MREMTEMMSRPRKSVENALQRIGRKAVRYLGYDPNSES